MSWNIRQGGGKRSPGIIQQIREWAPDIVGLSECRDSKPSRMIADTLLECGFTYQVVTKEAKDRGIYFLLLASRLPFSVQPPHKTLSPTGRWLHVKINQIDLILMHTPNRGQENRKDEFLNSSAEVLVKLKDTKAIAVGDTNSAKPGLDCETNFFKPGCTEEMWFKKLESVGWSDVWRHRNPDAREFTWYSSKGNGFRLDQAFATQSLNQEVAGIRYDWGGYGRMAGLSDHAAVILDLELPGKLD